MGLTYNKEMIWITTPRVRIKNEKSLYRNFLESLKQFPPGCQTLVSIVLLNCFGLSDFVGGRVIKEFYNHAQRKRCIERNG
jgi:hypothetical protein